MKHEYDPNRLRFPLNLLLLAWRKTKEQTNRAGVKMLAWFLAIQILAVPVIDLIERAWHSEGVLVDIVKTIFGIEFVIPFLIGVYIGILVLLWLDFTKRWQAILLTLATSVSISTILTEALISNLSFGGWMFLLPGMFVGTLIGGGPAIPSLQPPREFRRASRILAYSVSTLVLVSLFEAHTVYSFSVELTLSGLDIRGLASNFIIKTDRLLLDISYSVVFIQLLNGFLTYNGDVEVSLVGPGMSGKTTLLIGLYLTAEREHEQWPTNPTEPLVRAASRMDGELVGMSPWPSQTEGLTELSFNFWSGTYFRKHVGFRTIDYPGQHITDILDSFDGLGQQSKTIGVRNDNGHHTALVTIAGEEMRDSNVLLFLLDMERFCYGSRFETGSLRKSIEIYLKILDKLDTSSKEIILVATKADLLLDEFHGNPESNYPEFKRYVNETLLKDETTKLMVERLKTFTETEDVHPVYFEMTEESNSERPIPKTPAKMVGARELLDEIAE